MTNRNISVTWCLILSPKCIGVVGWAGLLGIILLNFLKTCEGLGCLGVRFP